MKSLSRNQFLASVAALGSSAVIGCGSDDDGGGSGGASGSGGSAGTAGSSSGGTAGTSSGGTAGTSSGGTAGTSGGGSSGTGSGGSSGSGGGAGAAGVSCDKDIVAQITCRHGHAMTVPAAHIALGASQQYQIKGSATHSHMVTVTAAMFAQLKAGQTVQISVSSQFQPHKIFLNCAVPDPKAKDNSECN
jgi:hypothetical protein